MSNPLPKLDQAPDAQRRRTMAAVKGANTSPELRVRCIAHSLGRQFRLHDKRLPGKPDLVFPRLKKVIFVHRFFWHGHNCKRRARTPKTNVEYWMAKIDCNRARDAANLAALHGLGWSVAIIWECETRDAHQLTTVLTEFLEVDH